MSVYRTKKVLICLLLLCTHWALAQKPRENIALVFENKGNYNIEGYSQKILSSLATDIDLQKTYTFKPISSTDWVQMCQLGDEFKKESFEEDECKKYVFKFTFSTTKTNSSTIIIQVWDTRTSLPIVWKTIYDQDMDEGTGNISSHLKHIVEYMKTILSYNKFCVQLNINLGDVKVCSISYDILSDLHSIRKNHFKYKYYLIRANDNTTDIMVKYHTESSKIHCNNNVTNGAPIYSPKINCSDPSKDNFDNVLNHLKTQLLK